MRKRDGDEGRAITDCGLISRTKQSFKDECDVNVVVRNHAQTGMWAHLNPMAPTYGDFSLATELQKSMQLVSDAQDEFMELPAAVRSLCNNDPVELLSRLAIPTAAQALVDAGLPVETTVPSLQEQIATGITEALAKEPPGATTPGEEGKTEPVSPSS